MPALDIEEGTLEEQVEARRWEISKQVRAAQQLDLAFLFDATGSMGPYMEAVKEKIVEIASDVADSFPDAMLRVACAFYRDYDDAQRTGACCDFTVNFRGMNSQFATAVAAMKAEGGADQAEDVFSGLETLCTHLKWKSTNRVVYHIGDAPCHGNRFHGPEVGDNYPQGDRDGRSIEHILCKLRDQCHISTYNFLHLNDTTRKMLEEFRKAAAHACWVIGEDALPPQEPSSHGGGTSGVQIDLNVAIAAKIVATCKATIARSLVAASKVPPGVTFKPLPVDSSVPADWTCIMPPKDAQVYRYKRYDDLDDMLRLIKANRSLHLRAKLVTASVRVAPCPFSDAGVTRWSFYAHMFLKQQLDTKVVVVKRFKDPAPSTAPGNATYKIDVEAVHAKERYFEQMEAEAVASHLAEAFNDETGRIRGCMAKELVFAKVSTLRLLPNLYYNMEKVLTGRWTNFNTNAGYSNEQTYTDTVQAFSHWTHERSNGLVMVTDIQAIETTGPAKEIAFLLCDPVIHSTNLLRFKRTNLGEKGFELFYKSHVCNTFCQQLGLQIPPQSSTQGTQK